MRRCFSRSLLASLIAVSSFAFATSNPCEPLLKPGQPYTLKSLREQSLVRTQNNELLMAKPGFAILENEIAKEQVGEIGPQALQEMLPRGMSFVATPAPTSADPVAVNLVKEDHSFPVHVDIPWYGQRTSTVVYASLPMSRTRADSAFLVGPEYGVTYFHLHGGGTATATGKNGMTIGERLASAGIPVLAPDLPGHGRATRQLKGFERFKEQADWVLEIAAKTIHPKVEIILSGHSWGGMFALYMHRLALNPDPKYRRIKRYISLSPGIDVSMSGNLEQNREFEERFSRHFNEFADQSAAADLEFMRNTLTSGKDSDVGSVFTQLTDFDLVTPRYTEEEQKVLPGLDVVVGDYDLNVKVGRSNYDYIFEGLTGDNHYVRLGMARTFKSDKSGGPERTGHNIFDAYIEGTNTPLVYNMLAERARPFLSESQKTPKKDVDPVDAVIDLVFRNWSNFFGFREMIEHQVEIVDQSTSHLPELSTRKAELDGYVKRVDQMRGERSRDPIKKVEVAAEKLARDLGFTEQIKISAAREELAMPTLTIERVQKLQDYVAAAEKVEHELKNSFSDPQFDSDVEALRVSYASVLEPLKLSVFEDYKKHLDSLVTKKTLSAEENALRSKLSRLHQLYAELTRQKQNRYSEEREKRMADVNRSAPEGVSTLKQALRELKTDHSPERRARLQRFVEGYANLETLMRATAARTLEADIEKLPRPMGFRTTEEVYAAKRELDSIFSFTFAPSDDSELSDLAGRIATLFAELEEVNIGKEGQINIERQHSALRDLKVRRAAAVKKWHGLWAKGVLTSDNYSRALQKHDSALAVYQEAYYSYQSEKSEWLVSLKRADKISADQIVDMPQRLKDLRQARIETEARFNRVLQETEAIRIRDALAGHLQGPDGAVKEAQKIAQDVLSAQAVKAFKSEEDAYEKRLRYQHSVIRALEQAKHEYTTRSLATGRPVPYVFERVPLYQHLSQSRQAFEAELRAKPLLVKAFQKALKRWGEVIGEARAESESKDTGTSVGY